MTLTHISSLESARKKIFMNSRYLVSRKYESNVFGLRRPTLTPISSLESARKKLFMNSRYLVSRKYESNVFGLRRPK